MPTTATDHRVPNAGNIGIAIPAAIDPRRRCTTTS